MLNVNGCVLLHVLNVLEGGFHVFLEHLVAFLLSSKFVCKEEITQNMEKCHTGCD